MAVLFAAIAAEVGRQDEWGDYPAAGGIAVVVVAAITIMALLGLTTSIGRRGAMPGETSLALGR
jgi:hypothetical protein